MVVKVSCAAAAVLVGAAPLASTEPVLRPGQVVVVAGTGVAGFSGDGWDARRARIGDTVNLAIAPDGTLYLTDYTGRVRSVSPDGVIHSVPGIDAARPADYDPTTRKANTSTAFSPDNMPAAATVAPDGTLYVAAEDTIGRVAKDSTVTVLAGGGDRSARRCRPGPRSPPT